MQHSGNWTGASPLRIDDVLGLLRKTIAGLDLEQARREVERFVRDKSSLELWSKDFFLEIISKIDPV